MWRPWGRQARSRGPAEPGLLPPEVVHGRVTARSRPALAGLDQRPARAPAAGSPPRPGGCARRACAARSPPLARPLRHVRRPRVLAVPAGRTMAGEGLPGALSTRLVGLSWRTPHSPSRAARAASAPASPRRSAFAGRGAGSGPARLLGAAAVRLARRVVRRVPREADVAPPDEGVGQRLAGRRPRPGVLVGRDEHDPGEAALARAGRQVLPRRAALAVGRLHRERPAPPLPVDPDRDRHGAAADDAGLAHLSVPGVGGQVPERVLQPPSGERRRAPVRPSRRRRRRRRRARAAPRWPPSPSASGRPGPAPPAGGRAPVSAGLAARARPERRWHSNGPVEKRPSRSARSRAAPARRPGRSGRGRRGPSGSRASPRCAHPWRRRARPSPRPPAPPAAPRTTSRGPSGSPSSAPSAAAESPGAVLGTGRGGSRRRGCGRRSRCGSRPGSARSATAGPPRPPAPGRNAEPSAR